MDQMLFAGADGLLYDHPVLRAAGRTGNRFVELLEEDLTVLPAGATLTMLPGGIPVGLTKTGKFTALERNPRRPEPVWAVGALLPQGYTRTLLPAYLREENNLPLPLMGYTAVSCRNGVFYGAFQPTDDPAPWDPANYDRAELPDLVRARLAENPANRLLGLLAKCALEYHCYTAQNIFYRRWEGGVPASPDCNARCLGCISRQPAECCPSPQERLSFHPTVEEIEEIALPHLTEGGAGAMVSFGQGCEGEPALAAATLSRAVANLRRHTVAGTINMNSNGGYPAGVEAICRAGLDAIRISLISAREETFQAYYRPRGYDLREVRRSLRFAADQGVYVALNLLTLPGLTDRPEETKALEEFLLETGVDLVQLRNLNIDPDWLWPQLPESQEAPLGIDRLIAALAALPGLKVGNYSRPVR